MIHSTITNSFCIVIRYAPSPAHPPPVSMPVCIYRFVYVRLGARMPCVYRFSNSLPHIIRVDTYAGTDI